MLDRPTSCSSSQQPHNLHHNPKEGLQLVAFVIDCLTKGNVDAVSPDDPIVQSLRQILIADKAKSAVDRAALKGGGSGDGLNYEKFISNHLDNSGQSVKVIFVIIMYCIVY